MDPHTRIAFPVFRRYIENPISGSPFRYACGSHQNWKILSFLVVGTWKPDLAGGQEGVIGAQVAGAGLGGCAMILVRTDALKGLLSALRAGYYRPRKLAFDVHVCRPVGGSGILTV